MRKEHCTLEVEGNELACNSPLGGQVATASTECESVENALITFAIYFIVNGGAGSRQLSVVADSDNVNAYFGAKLPPISVQSYH